MDRTHNNRAFWAAIAEEYPHSYSSVISSEQRQEGPKPLQSYVETPLAEHADLDL